MKKKILLTLAFIFASIVLAIYTIPILKSWENRRLPIFSEQANLNFANSIAKDVALNSDITMERAEPVNSEQINNVSFYVFNHTDEPILFSDQGFGLAAFTYDEIDKTWKELQLPHTPFPELTILPPRTENWNPKIDNSWDILENDTTSLGYQKIRFYVLGKGKITNTSYGAYLDVIISKSN
jgi:hypothetical protein